MTAVEFWYSGNRIQKTEGGVTTAYTFDDENRLVQVVRGYGTIIYAYDPLGRRIAKSFGDVVNWYVYDGNAIIAAYNSSGTVTARYAHGLNIDEPLAVQQGSATSFYHADGLGSIVALTNAAGSVVQTYSYDSFGNITPSGGITQPFTYTAREYDSETGLYFYRARYYDPKAGRFITKDPISFAGGDVNLYGYVKNNPVNKTDPHGLKNWGNAIGQALDGPVGNALGYGADTIGMAMDASGDWGYYGGAVIGAAGAVAGSAIGPWGTVAGGIVGGAIGGWLGSLLDDPCAGQLNCNEPMSPRPSKLNKCH